MNPGPTACRGVVAAVTVAVALLGSLPARADAVDDAFARGNQEAQAGQWDEAVKHYQRAAQLLPGPNSTLSYNLGTAHAHRGDLGPATYHLRRALEFAGGPTAAVLEAARTNVEVVRQQVEVAAAAHSRQVDRPATWWDLLLDALRAPWIGWLSLISGGFVLVSFLFDRSRRRSRPNSSGVWLPALQIVCGLVYLCLGVAHGWALRVDETAPQAIVLDEAVQAHARPGAHGDVEFVLQGGACVRIVDESPGWRRVRLPGGLEGWVEAAEIGALDMGRNAPGAWDN